mgnify:CR=1 FL=1
MSDQNQNQPTQVVQQSVPVGGNIPKLPQEYESIVNARIQEEVQKAMGIVKTQNQQQLDAGKAAQEDAKRVKEQVEALLKEKADKEAAEAAARKIAEEEAEVKKKKEKEEAEAKLNLTQKVELYQKASEEAVAKVSEAAQKRIEAVEAELNLTKLQNATLKLRSEIPESDLPALMFPQIQPGETLETFTTKVNQQKEIYAKLKEDVLKQSSLPTGSPAVLGGSNLTGAPSKSWDDLRKVNKPELAAIKDDIWKKYNLK